MTTIADVGQVISKFLRDVLRGVNSAGDDNGYVTTINHPDDYVDLEASPLVLKAENLWKDKRTYIINGQVNDDNGIGITVNYVDCDDNVLSAQGLQCFDADGCLFKIIVDTTKLEQLRWRYHFASQIAGQVRETLQKNITKLYQDIEFENISVRPFDASSEDTILFNVDFTADIKITAS